MAFLGQIISSEGDEVDPSKSKEVKNSPTLLCPTDTRFFLVLAVYYKRFVDGFASIEFPLTTLTQKSVTFE